jgi:hypothetical protein
MCVDDEKFLPSEQKAMDAAAFVGRAREMAALLEDREIATSRSRPLARAAVARLAGVPASLLHSLRYRPPKTIAADAYRRLCMAVECQAARQIGHLENEILTHRARLRSADDRNLRKVVDALALARALMGKAK